LHSEQELDWWTPERAWKYGYLELSHGNSRPDPLTSGVKVGSDVSEGYLIERGKGIGVAREH
jgi:hypothetical protein